MTRRFIVVGAGGQARETACLISDLRSAGEDVEVAGFAVSDLSRLTDRDTRDSVVGDFTWLRANRDRFDALAMGVGTPAIRLRLAELLLADFDESWWPPLVHPTAIYDRATCRLQAGSSLAPGVVATVNVRLDAFAFANFGCTIGHEAQIGRGSVVNPGANISGGVVIGSGVLIGTGAQVLQYRTIGPGAIVGAGAVVTHDVSGGATVIGCPARPVSSGGMDA